MCYDFSILYNLIFVTIKIKKERKDLNDQEYKTNRKKSRQQKIKENLWKTLFFL